MDAALDFQAGIRDLATIVFEGYEAMGIIDDAAPYIEAASEKGYKEFNSGGTKIATDYNPSTKQRERVPVRKQGAANVPPASKQQQSPSVDKKQEQGKSSSDDTLSRMVRDNLYQLGKDPEAMQKVKIGGAVAGGLTVAVISIGLGAVILAGTLLVIPNQAEAEVKRRDNAVQQLLSKTEVEKSLNKTFAKIDPEAATHFRRAYSVAASNFRENGVKGGWEKTQKYLTDLAESETKGGGKGKAKIRGAVAGVGAVLGGVIGTVAYGIKKTKSAIDVAGAFFSSLPTKVGEGVKKMGQAISRLPEGVSGIMGGIVGMFAGMQAFFSRGKSGEANNTDFSKLNNSFLDSINNDLQKKFNELTQVYAKIDDLSNKGANLSKEEKALLKEYEAQATKMEQDLVDQNMAVLDTIAYAGGKVSPGVAP